MRFCSRSQGLRDSRGQREVLGYKGSVEATSGGPPRRGEGEYSNRGGLLAQCMQYDLLRMYQSNGPSRAQKGWPELCRAASGNAAGKPGAEISGSWTQKGRLSPTER